MKQNVLAVTLESILTVTSMRARLGMEPIYKRTFTRILHELRNVGAFIRVERPWHNFCLASIVVGGSLPAPFPPLFVKHLSGLIVNASQVDGYVGAALFLHRHAPNKRVSQLHGVRFTCLRFASGSQRLVLVFSSSSKGRGNSPCGQSEVST